MQLIRHDDIRRVIEIKLTVAPKYVKRDYGLTIGGRELVDEIMTALSGCVIAKPSMVDNGARHGRFGVTEPHPFPNLVNDNGDPLRWPELRL